MAHESERAALVAACPGFGAIIAALTLIDTCTPIFRPLSRGFEPCVSEQGSERVCMEKWDGQT